MVTIRKQSAGQSVNVYRIYEFAYAKTLTSIFDNRNFFIKSLLLIKALLSNIGYLFKSFLRSVQGLSRKQKFESLYLFFIIMALSLFGLILLPALITIIADGIRSLMGLKIASSTFNSTVQSWLANLQAFSKVVVGITTALFVFAPKYQSVITGTAASYLCINEYMSSGAQKDVLNGKLLELLEFMSETESPDLDIEVHAYSFGAILAVDTIFTYDKHMPEQVIKDKVKCIITIAIPFDFLRVYFTSYYKNRTGNGLQIKRWINVNCAFDILSSNFRNDANAQNGDPAVTPGNIEVENVTYNLINPDAVGFFHHLSFIGLRAHRMYWNSDVNAKSFLHMLVPYLNLY